MTTLTTRLTVHVHGPCDDRLRAALALAGQHCTDDDGIASTWTRQAAVSPPPPAADTRLLLTIPQASSRLGVSRSTAYRLIAAGRLRVVHVGRSVRVSADEVTGVVRRLEAEAAGDAVASPPAAGDRWCDHLEQTTYVQEQLPA